MADKMTNDEARSGVIGYIQGEREFTLIKKAGMARGADDLDRQIFLDRVAERKAALPERNLDPKIKALDLGIRANQETVTMTGDYKVAMTPQAISDVKALVADKRATFTHAADFTDGKGVVHPAGSVRYPSAQAEFLANNIGAVRNTSTGAVGVDALPSGDKRTMNAYMSVDALVTAAQKTRFPVAMLAAVQATHRGTVNTQADIERGRFIAASKAKAAEKAGGASR